MKQNQNANEAVENNNSKNSNFDKKSNKKKPLIIMSVIIGVLLIAGGTVLLLNREEKTPKITLDQAKEYLEKNWDNFNIDGSTSLIPLHQALNDQFSSAKEEIKHNKTVDAFEKFIKGENDILLGVTYSDELLNKSKNSGVDLGSKKITREGFIFLINKNNPVKSLTIEQIKDIYSGEITNWKDVGGDDVPIQAFQRNDDSGSQIRMNKFMGKTKLMDKTYIAEGMGELILSIAGFNNVYDETKYAIGYNMYTFTEKQYYNDEIVLLSVNGVQPTDKTIFDESYPIVIYNYAYYDKNNELASEFANNLYVYLMSEEGQKLISYAGYVNLNEKLDRNKDVELPYEREYIDFYNEEKGEFYDVDDNGKLIVFKNYPDFMLHNKSKYKNNQNARGYLTTLFNSGIISSMIWIDAEKGTIELSGIWFNAAFDVEDMFNIRYNNMYYDNLVYFIDEDKYILETTDKENVDFYSENGYLDGFPVDVIAPNDIEITKNDLKDIFIRPGIDETILYQPFK